jgi:hypothetical protein
MFATFFERDTTWLTAHDILAQLRQKKNTEIFVKGQCAKIKKWWQYVPCVFLFHADINMLMCVSHPQFLPFPFM